MPNGWKMRGREDIGSDVVLDMAHGHRLGQPGLHPLDRDVGFGDKLVADQAAYRTHVDDAADAADSPQQRQCVLDAEKCPRTFTANILSRFSALISSMLWRMLIPALFTKTSIFPLSR